MKQLNPSTRGIDWDIEMIADIEIPSNIGLLIDIKLLMSWNFIPEEKLNVNRISNRDSVKKFEDGF